MHVNFWVEILTLQNDYHKKNDTLHHIYGCVNRLVRMKLMIEKLFSLVKK